MLEKTKELFPQCKNDSAWNTDNIKAFSDCTLKISSSNPKILGNMADIKVFSKSQNGSFSIQTQLEQITEDVQGVNKKMDPILHKFTLF